jgi:hypothetical protein
MNSSSGYMAEPPLGQLRHITNPPTLHNELATVAISTCAVAFIAVALHLFTRTRVTEMGVHLNDRKSRLVSSYELN